MAGRNVPLILCPYLGSWRDRETPHGYPTSQNCCYVSPGDPRQISNDHQQDFCLADYATCPYFPAPMPEDQPLPRGERRRARRLPGGDLVAGQIRRPLQARILDLSDHGALVEHGEQVHPGELVELRIEAGDSEVTVLAEVVRSFVANAAATPGGRGTFYRTGCEFIGRPSPTLTRILSLLEAPSGLGGNVPGPFAA